MSSLFKLNLFICLFNFIKMFREVITNFYFKEKFNHEEIH